MEFCLSRTDGDGLVVPREGDWVFIDWGKLDLKEGNCAEQILMVRSLEVMAECAALLGEDGSRYTERAAALRKKVEELYWDEERAATSTPSGRDGGSFPGTAICLPCGTALTRTAAGRRSSKMFF